MLRSVVQHVALALQGGECFPLHAFPLVFAPCSAWLRRAARATAQVECFQQQVEPILYAAGVDMVYTGHTHAYEVRADLFWQIALDNDPDADGLLCLHLRRGPTGCTR